MYLLLGFFLNSFCLRIDGKELNLFINIYKLLSIIIIVIFY